MKKKVYSVIFASAVCAGVLMLGNKQDSEYISDLMYDNVEALASGEGNYQCSASATCTTSEYKNGKWEKVATGSVGCTGGYVCSSGEGWVECDGKRSTCG